ncbi:MAG: hypothetical protein J6X44_07955 [Thermoguttaceae bacterium]|nr:hypothetical protein [Thermoguttaceae bacterium]
MEKAGKKVGFVTVIACEESLYHNSMGSIHCGTNVLRKMPSSSYGLEWWRLYED